MRKKYLVETDSQEKPNVGFSKDFKVHIINSILGKYDPNELIDQSLQRKGGCEECIREDQLEVYCQGAGERW